MGAAGSLATHTIELSPPGGQGIGRDAIHKKEILVSNDHASYPNAPQYIRDLGVHSAMAIPLKKGGR